MSGDTEIDDLEVSDGASENGYSEHEHEHDLVSKEDDNTDMAEQKYRPDGDENGKNGGSTAITTKPKVDPKDPTRQRRKKARRACYACQRAHLTCGKLPLSLMSSECFLGVNSFKCLCKKEADFNIVRRRATMPAMYKAWTRRCVSRRRQEEGKIPSRRTCRSTSASPRTKLQPSKQSSHRSWTTAIHSNDCSQLS